MGKLTAVLLGIFVASSAIASVTLKNEDSTSYKLLLKSSQSCFSGTHTSISGGTTSTQIDAGWACLNEKKPAVKLEDGKTYVIKDGKIVKK
ncbi:MAG: hypothetical protein CR967_01135 [Proteobacteria bacterium]|nr:MAG: hypothetical protein CR967_01135 [Pseudomonadota bacterium]